MNGNHSQLGGVESEFLHQANAGVFELTPGLVYESTSLNLKGLTITGVSNSGFLVSGGGEYGINSQFSVGGTLQYESLSSSYTPTSTITPKTSGIKDPKISLKGILKIEVFSFSMSFMKIIRIPCG